MGAFAFFRFATKGSRNGIAKFCGLLCLLVWWAMAGQVAWAGADKVRVGYYENEIFQEGASEDAVKTGYAYEYYRKLSEYTGWKYEYVYGSYADLYQMLLAGRIDLLAGLAKTEERAGLIGYPSLPMGSESYNIVKHANDSSITYAADTLNGKRIGVLEGAMSGAMHRYLASHGIGAEVILYPDYPDVLRDFDDNWLDVMLVEGNGTYGRANADPLYAIGSTDFYLCVNPQRPDLLAALNDAQEQLAVEEPNYLYLLNVKYHPATISSRALSPVEKDWLATHDTLRVGYFNHYLPFSDTDSNGEVTGLVGDLVSDMLEKMSLTSLEVSYTAYDSYDEMIEGLTQEKIDVAFPVGGGLFFGEKNGINLSNTVISSGAELICKGAYREGNLSSIAVNENNRMQYYYIKKYFPESEIIYCPSAEACLEAVTSGRAQGTIMNELRADPILKNRRYRELIQHPLPHDDERSFGVRIGNEGLLRLLNRGLNIVGEEQANKLAYKYVEGLYSYTAFDMLMDNQWIIAVTAGLVAFLVAVSFARESKRARERMVNVTASLAEAIDAKDAYTKGHSGRVAEYSREIARRYGYDRKGQDNIYMMGLLHDVGKIGVPDVVINKAGRLTDEEFAKIKKHPSIGSRILKNIQEMPTLAKGARWHHERYDGRGYPDGLAGNEIPEESRIIAVADAYDAMSSSRSYRKAMSQEAVREEIEKGKGSQFDPRFADIMLAMIDEDKDYKMQG